MNKARCLGLVGGLGVGATVHYYQSLAKALQKNGRTLDIVITHAETSRVYECVQAADRDGLAAYLLGFIQRMHAAGAELAAIPAVTPHFCIRDLVTRSPIPLVNLFDSLTLELTAREGSPGGDLRDALRHRIRSVWFPSRYANSHAGTRRSESDPRNLYCSSQKRNRNR